MRTVTVLDTGALIALERGDRLISMIVADGRKNEERFVVPAGVIAQAWRGGPRQARVARFLRSDDCTIRSLDDDEARRVGVLLARTGTSDAIDASVVVAAQTLAPRNARRIVTSDPDDMRALLPDSRIEAV